MLDSDWSKKMLLRSDWLGPSVAIYTIGVLSQSETAKYFELIIKVAVYCTTLGLNSFKGNPAV